MSECECQNWPRIHGLLAEHHENCQHHNLRKDAIDQLTALVRGVEYWAAEEDGVPEFVWDAYVRAKLSIGEIMPLAKKA